MEYCILTGLPILNKGHSSSGLYYTIAYNNDNHTFRFCYDCFNKINLIEYQHVFRGFLRNGKVNFKKQILTWDNSCTMETPKVLLSNEVNFWEQYLSPSFLKNNLLLGLRDKTQSYGEFIQFGQWDMPDLIPDQFYFRSHKEFSFYLNTLKVEGLIELKNNYELGDDRKPSAYLQYHGEFIEPLSVGWHCPKINSINYR